MTHIYTDPTNSTFMFGKSGFPLFAEVEFCNDTTDVHGCGIQQIRWKLGHNLSASPALTELLEFMSAQVACDDALYDEFRRMHCPKARRDLELQRVPDTLTIN